MKAGKKYLITMLVGFAIVAMIVWSKDIFQQTAPVVIYHILCDAFFVSGVLLFASGLLIFSANEGTFDIFVYGMRSFLDMFRKVSRKKFDTFYDYRVSKADSKVPFGFLLLCGLFFLVVAAVMFVLYRQYNG